MTAARPACLHAAASNVALFDAVSAVPLRHSVRPDLLAAVEAAGALTPAIAAEVRSAVAALGPGPVIVTCTTLAPAVEGMRGVVRIDTALAARAAAAPGPRVALHAAPGAAGPTEAMFDGIAEARAVPGAWALFQSGDMAGYLDAVTVAAAAAFAAGAATVVLTQASMAPAARDFGARALAAPTAALAAALG